MKVVTHTPEPTPPENTYDLLGLTEEEVTILGTLLGSTSFITTPAVTKLYEDLPPVARFHRGMSVAGVITIRTNGATR